MCHNFRNVLHAWSPAALAALLATVTAVADVSLVLQPAAPPCPSRYVDVELYAFADGATAESIAAMDVILSWDPAVLELRGIQGTEELPYAWLFSWFPGDSALDGLNDTWSDGDALYEALAQLGSPAYASSEGLLVTVFRFYKSRVGVPTQVEMPERFGAYTATAVYSGSVPGLITTGQLQATTVIPSAEGDLNCDTYLNVFDIDPFVVALVSAADYAQQFPACDRAHADTNCDGQVNTFDIDPFVRLLVGE